MLQKPTLSYTITAGEALTANTVVAFGGSYANADTENLLGVVDCDAASGELVTVHLKGILSVKMADSETVDVGETLGVDAAGMGTASDSGDAILTWLPVLKTSADGYALVIV